MLNYSVAELRVYKNVYVFSYHSTVFNNKPDQKSDDL